MTRRAKRRPRERIPTATYLRLRWSPCAACGRRPPSDIDHIIPVRLGGRSNDENLQPLCARCNGAKGGRVIALADLVRYRDRTYAERYADRKRARLAKKGIAWRVA